MRISNKEHTSFLPLVLTSLLIINTFSSNANDVINATHSISDGETLISSGGSFELGFFSPGNSNNRYVGIWYKKITAFTVVWVANRDTPITNTSSSTSSVLKITEPGTLTLVDANNVTIWSSNGTSGSPDHSPVVAQLLDSGNLVVKSANEIDPENYLWQSFDHPTDTLLAGMKFGKNLVTGRETYISAWRAPDDPGTGDYTYRLDPTGYPQAVLNRGSVEVYRAGPWNGVGYSGLPGMRANSVFSYELVMDRNEVFYRYEVLNSSVIPRFVVNESGVAQRWTWVGRTQEWVLYMTAPMDNCDSYRQCGSYGNCNVGTSPICRCLTNFVPRNVEEWEATDWSNGCDRRAALNCTTDGFLKYSGIKLPDTRRSWFNTSMSLEECEDVCRRNCSCVAYTNLDIRNGGSGCLLWFGDLVDIRELQGGEDIYIRMASSELNSKNNNPEVLIVSLTSVMGVILLGIGVMLCLCKRKKIRLKLRKRGWHEETHDEDLELPLFNFSIISKATNNFSPDKKIGEGGFGPVYKGTMEDGQEIAVKRLSSASMQGVNEFKNEVIFIAKLQHRNLVKLLGCCIQGEENMLVYEYMPNKSLDFILFDKLKSNLLDWPKRFQIISGIARGLMYLHQDSRLNIIHRDLKVSNILLDTDMNPKISDFGLARSFGRNETEATNTNRVVGTYGYMPPEYAVDGLFSVKSDVYSFGVIVLEILSGKKNRGYCHGDHHLNLLGHAWILYKEGRSLELVDNNLVDSCYLSQMLRSIHVGLLCVQKFREDRPSMSAVVFMLENDVVMPEPKEPGFFIERDVSTSDISTTRNTSSTNGITITLPQAR